MTTATKRRPSAHQDYENVDEVIRELTRSYWMEIETVQNYLAASTNPVGVRAQEIKESLAKDITEELGHAQMLAKRIHVLGGQVPGSNDFKPQQDSLQPPEDPTDLPSIIQGVIEAETGAIEQYRKIIDLCEGSDHVTQDMCVALLADEEEHRRQFRGFLTEFGGDSI